LGHYSQEVIAGKAQAGWLGLPGPQRKPFVLLPQVVVLPP